MMVLVMMVMMSIPWYGDVDNAYNANNSELSRATLDLDDS